jgi:thiamine biosynthesis lipoprotein
MSGLEVRLTGAVQCASWDQRTVSAMGSDAVLIAGDAPAEAMDWALRELERLESCWSRFRPDSELRALNASAGNWCTVSPTLADAIDRCIRLSALTEGCFDPTLLDRMLAIGYDRSFRDLDRDQSGVTPRAQPSGGVARIERDGDRVRLPGGVMLDLGGIGKGLAADVLAVGLVARGAVSACVSLGGDIRVAGGVPDEGGWNVPVTNPLAPEAVLGCVPLAHEAIVTSTTTIRTWRRGGNTMHHLIDPHTGLPSVGDVVAAIVTAPEAWLAEGIAKAAIVAGRSRGVQLLDRSGFGGWLVLADGSLVAGQWAPTLVQTSRRLVHS